MIKTKIKAKKANHKLSGQSFHPQPTTLLKIPSKQRNKLMSHFTSKFCLWRPSSPHIHHIKLFQSVTRDGTCRALTLIFSLLVLPAFNLNSDAYSAPGVDRRLVARAQAVTKDVFRYAAQTPRGARVLAVSEPGRYTLEAVDQGLTTLFDVARRRGYKARLRYQDYVIFIARPDRTKNGAGDYSPDIALPANQYGGSVYDQGGFIYAAGFVVAYTPCALIVAEHEVKDLKRLADVVRFEGEHIVLYHNDTNLYRKTADHSSGGGHPILK